MIIDVHGHVSLPDELYVYKANLLAHRGAHGRGGVRVSDDQLRAAMLAPNHSFGGISHFEHIDAAGIDVQFISPRPFHMMHSESAKLVTWFTEETNNLIYRVCELYPKRFRGVAGLPQSPELQPAQWVSELRRTVQEMKFVGCLLNPDPFEGAGHPPALGDHYWYPLYEALCELDIPAFIHSAGCRPPARETYSLHFIIEETIAVASLLSSDVFKDFPSLNIVVCHGGGAIPSMAKITLGIGTSHAPLLNTPPERWGERGSFDRKNPSLWYRGKSYTFAELLAARGGPEAFAAQCQLSAQERSYQRCKTAIAQLGSLMKEAAPDVLVIVSSDHKEIFNDELLPGFAIYWGDEVAHVPYTEAQLRAMPPGIAVAEVTNVPEVLTMRPCHSQLALHLIYELGKHNFDISASRSLPAGHYENHGIPHGWGFIYQQLLDGAQVPFVPVFINTFYEPNPPSAARSLEFGRALCAAIASWPEDLHVGLVASGGLTHFVVDEDQDRAFLAALRDYDGGYLGSLDAALLRAGTSELRNWIAVIGALGQTNLTANFIDYVPCYRTEAGTGCVMGFVAWS